MRSKTKRTHLVKRRWYRVILLFWRCLFLDCSGPGGLCCTFRACSTAACAILGRDFSNAAWAAPSRCIFSAAAWAASGHVCSDSLCCPWLCLFCSLCCPQQCVYPWTSLFYISWYISIVHLSVLSSVACAAPGRVCSSPAYTVPEYVCLQ